MYWFHYVNSVYKIEVLLSMHVLVEISKKKNVVCTDVTGFYIGREAMVQSDCVRLGARRHGVVHETVNMIALYICQTLPFRLFTISLKEGAVHPVQPLELGKPTTCFL